jgi:electron transport complex protein RnfC
MSRILTSFAGGLKLEPHKDSTRHIPSRSVEPPNVLYLPLQQHIGSASVPCVAVGQRVVRGEVVADSPAYVGMRLHAPTAGVISSIGDFPVIHPSGLHGSCIEIRPDDVSQEALSVSNDSKKYELENLDLRTIFERIQGAGIVGLGGAGFPTHVKINEGSAQRVETLIINGVECEPYITCDDRLMQEQAEEIVAGAKLLSRILSAAHCIIAVEDDMQDAFEALNRVPLESIELLAIPAIYPAGSEKQLITVLTGMEVPDGLLPINIGVATVNVATAWAIYRAVVEDEPLTRRIVTVAGEISNPGNVNVLIGTPVQHVLDQCGQFDAGTHRVFSGGPMMGVEIHDTKSPITKTTNCLLVTARQEHPEAQSACIRCGECLPVCPVKLQPQQLYDAARVADVDAAQDLHLLDCIECGCCSYVCPSAIPLVHYFRYAKSSIEALDADRTSADYARGRYDRREQRLEVGNVTDGHQEIALADVSELEVGELQDHVRDAIARAAKRRSKS